MILIVKRPALPGGGWGYLGEEAGDECELLPGESPDGENGHRETRSRAIELLRRSADPAMSPNRPLPPAPSVPEPSGRSWAALAALRGFPQAG